MDITKSMKPSAIKNMRIVDDKYVLFNKLVIGKGSFGKVVYGKLLQEGKEKEVCFKVERSVQHKSSMLKEEYKIYQQLSLIDGVPKVYQLGSYRNFNFVAMDLLGPSLDKFFNVCNKKLKIETSIFFGIQMIELLRNVHSSGIIHRDIKPNNFLFGTFSKDIGISNDKLYIIDFGLSARFIDPITNNHIPCKTNSKFIGTPRYASLNTHQGIKQSRRDDLESVAYILIYFISGDLPWQGVKAKTKSEKKEKIREIKAVIDFDKLEEYKSVPVELKAFLKYCKELGYYETPNYSKLQLLLKSLQSRLGIPEIPSIWEWDDLLMQGQYSQMKKKYRSLFEGYPCLQFPDYLKVIKEKKQNVFQPRFIKICLDSEASLVETQCDSKNSIKLISDKAILKETTEENNFDVDQFLDLKEPEV